MFTAVECLKLSNLAFLENVRKRFSIVGLDMLQLAHVDAPFLLPFKRSRLRVFLDKKPKEFNRDDALMVWNFKNASTRNNL